MAPAAKSRDQLQFDTHLLDVYLTGLQSEIEAKLRRVNRFRQQMKKIDASGGKTDRAARVRAAKGLLEQVDDMLDTNLLVRETLQELRKAAAAVLADLKDLEE